MADRQTKDEDSILERLFARPLITGASVSADHLTLSPGKRLALMYSRSQGEIMTIARGNVPGRETLCRVTDGILSTRSIVIALDALFWDSATTSCQASVDVARSFAERCNRKRVPFVLGDIPALLPNGQPCRYVINRAIHELPHEFPYCRVFHLDHLYQRELHGELRIRGSHHSVNELLPDGLHLSRLASEGLTDRLRRVCLEFRDHLPTSARIPLDPQPDAG